MVVGTKLGNGKIFETANDGKLLGEDNLNSQLHKYISRRVIAWENIDFFNTIYNIDEIPEAWKNSVIIPIYMEDGKQRVENCSLIHVFYKIWYNCEWKIESTGKRVPFVLPEWNLKRQILYWCIVQYENTYRKRKL